MTAALYAVDATQTPGLTAEETVTLGKLRNQLSARRLPNAKKYVFYEGMHKARNLEIAVPAHLADVDVHVGAPGIVVDVLAERIEWDGWTAAGGDLYGLDDDYRDNELEVEQARQTVDSLICGVDFINLSYGGTGEPDVLITAESPMNATVLWNPRTRSADAGLIQERDPLTQLVTAEWMKLPDETIRIDRNGGRIDIERFQHRLGVVPMVAFPNRERPSDIWGRSEITPTVRYFTEAIGRSLLGMEIHREIYTAPNRYMLGVDPKQFGIDPDSPQGSRIVKQWDIAMSKMNMVPRMTDNPSDPMPTVGQFPASPPTPYIDQIKHYLQHLSAESAVPWNYWGFQTDNPPSADAVRVLESRLVKRALLRQRMWTRAWRQVGFIALKHKDKTVTPEVVSKISPNWKDPATPTPSAAADLVTKYVQAEILPKHSRVTLRKAQFSEADIDEIMRDWRKESMATAVDRLTRTPVEIPAPPEGAADQASDDSAE